MKNKKRRLIIICVILLIIIGIAHHWIRKHQAEKQTDASTAVLATYPVYKMVSNSISVIGSVVATAQTYITPKIAGYISQIFFTEGQYVKADTPLIQLDATKMKAQVASDTTAYNISNKQYVLYQKIFKKGLITKEQMENEHATAATNLSQLTQDRQLLNENTLRAPFAGYLGAKTISVGDYVNPAQQLVLLVDRDHLQVTYNVQEKYIPFLQLGQVVTVVSQLNSAYQFSATISYIAPAIDNASRTIEVHAQINDPQHKLLPGQYVIVKQNLSKPIQALFIPEQAVIPSLEGSTVFIATKNKAKEIKIITGNRENGLIEVTHGLTKNDQVIFAGQEKLHEEQSVSVTLSQQKN